MTFKEWCEKNGKLWMGAGSFKQFEKNAEAYEQYRKTQTQNQTQKRDK